MAPKIETLEGEDALTELLLFFDKVYESRDARWTALVPLQLPTLMGQSPYSEGRTFHPLVAREDGEIVARAVAVIDERYQEYWNSRLGHVTMFEALPDTREAIKLLIDEACGWLRGRGCDAARAGFGGGIEFPFAIDDYDSLPPQIMRQNPAYYHALLKDAGFESERGWVDYKIRVTPELVERYESAVESARQKGYELVPFGDFPEDRRVPVFTEVWNEAFKAHWGQTPFSRAEVGMLFEFLGPFGMLEHSRFAVRDGTVVGVLWVTPEATMMASTRPGRELRPDEKLNFLGIGVLSSDRGRGVNVAMAASSYLALVEHGASYLSYTLVLDDNWPSRRTAEKLGAYVCANYMVYRRNFGR